MYRGRAQSYNGGGEEYGGRTYGNNYLDMDWQQASGFAGGYGYNPYFPNYQDPVHMNVEEAMYLVYDEELEEAVEDDDESEEDEQKGNDIQNHQPSQTLQPAHIMGLDGTDERNSQPKFIIPGISTPAPASTTPKPDKQANERKAAELRAKLMAARNTPNRDKSVDAARPTPPNQSSGPPSVTASKDVMDEDRMQTTAGATVTEKPVPIQRPSERKETAIDIEGLLAEGRAAADAKAKKSVPPSAQNRDTDVLPSQARNDSQRPKDANVNGSSSERANEMARATTPEPTQPPDRSHLSNGSTEAGEIREDIPRSVPKTNSRIAVEDTTAPLKESNMRSYNQNQSLIHRTDSTTDGGVPDNRSQQARSPPPARIIHTDRDRTNDMRHGQSKATSRRDDARDQGPAKETRNSASDGSAQQTRTGPATSQSLVLREEAPNNVQTIPPAGTAAAHSQYFADLDEWLVVTGYHDLPYRKSKLREHKLQNSPAMKQYVEKRARIEKELEEEKATIERTLEVEDSSALTRSGSRQTQPVQAAESAHSSSALAMPPPPLRNTSNTASFTSPTKTVDSSVQSTPTTAAQTGSKRPPPSPPREHARADKFPRTDTARRRSGDDPPAFQKAPTPRRPNEPGIRIRGAVEEDHPPQSRREPSRGRMARSASPPMLAHRISMPEDHPSRRGPRDDPYLAKSAYHQGPESSHRYDVGYRGGYEPRGISQDREGRNSYYESRDPALNKLAGRRGSFSGRNNYHKIGNHNNGGQSRHYSSGAASLNLRGGGTRYFMIKSWNYDNVEASQRDGTWATQPQNEDKFTEAFNTCRHVILVFSVNKSMAFQGYARMESLPGTAPTPSWVKNLLWQSSPPFHVRWITIAETRFSRVGHLKNALNENQPVLVGRDGQEIEEQCGASLCELIDEERERGGGAY